MTKDFHERFVEALRCRLYPNTNLHLKQLADAVGRSESSVTRWWRGDTRILAEDLERIARYFVGRGDRTFLRAIFDEPPQGKSADDNGDELKGLLRSVLAALPAAANDVSATDTYLWATGDGAVVPAPLGHAEYAARALHLPATIGDMIRYATGILGWMAVTVGLKGIVTVRHDGRHVAPIAAEALCQWLMGRQSDTPAVYRSILIGGAWVEARHDSVELAIEALQRVAFIVKRPRRPWSVKRLPLDSIANDRLKMLLRIHRDAPDQVIHTAAAAGALTDSNILSADGENVISLFVPPKYLLSRQAIEGQNIMSVPDTEYAMMVRSRVLTTKREGPVYCELEGTLNNEYLHYLNLAIPEPGPHGKVLTSTVVLDHKIYA